MPGDLLLFFFNGNAALFQIRNHILKAFLFFADLLFCRGDNVVGQAQLGGNGEGVALAGNADKESVGGLQGLHVEFAAGVLHKGGGEGVDLQLAVVGGGHGADASVVEVVQDGNGQGRSLRGVRACAQLVKEAEGIHVRMT